MIRYPGNLDEAVAGWLAAQGGSVREGAEALSARYKRGGVSQARDLTAYVTTRLPATFAVNARVLSEVALVLPDLAPESLRDVGAGPGTASWAGVAQWATLHRIEQVEAVLAFCQLAKHLNDRSDIAALRSAQVVQGNLRETPQAGADVVIASYVLAELPEADAAALGRHLWQQADKVLVLIEPGTPQGFARLKLVRARLLRDGAHVVGPCTHDLECPMANGNWCHFKQRVQRNRAHMQAKAAVVPFEDEPYSWLALARRPVVRHASRIVAPVMQSKIGLDLPVCTEGILRDIHVASRNKAQYKRLKKAAWGEAVTIEEAT